MPSSSPLRLRPSRYLSQQLLEWDIVQILMRASRPLLAIAPARLGSSLPRKGPHQAACNPRTAPPCPQGWQAFGRTSRAIILCCRYWRAKILVLQGKLRGNTSSSRSELHNLTAASNFSGIRSDGDLIQWRLGVKWINP